MHEYLYYYCCCYYCCHCYCYYYFIQIKIQEIHKIHVVYKTFSFYILHSSV